MKEESGSFEIDVVKGKVYEIGGRNGKKEIEKVEKYDKKEKKWNKINNLNIERWCRGVG
jgi:hypothetical protein